VRLLIPDRAYFPGDHILQPVRRHIFHMLHKVKAIEVWDLLAKPYFLEVLDEGIYLNVVSLLGWDVLNIVDIEALVNGVMLLF
jgi:hypothetical protein